MLFSVEGGSFFSSSSQGYSKGLALLLLEPRNEERPMKITPWSRYQLAEQEGIPDFELASRKIRLNPRCASFNCIGRASAGIDGSFPPKVGPVQQPESSSSLTSDKIDISSNIDNVNDIERKVCLKSSLKRASENHSEVASIAHESSEVKSASHVTTGRKVQWKDACGRELVQLREFECSGDEASDDEYENEGKKCVCVIQ